MTKVIGGVRSLVLTGLCNNREKYREKTQLHEKTGGEKSEKSRGTGLS
jgi:hypothetical protein